MRRLAFRCALVLLGFVVVTGPVSAQSTIFRSAGPSAEHYPVGRHLPADARLVLRPGDTVILTQGEFARTFRGPGSFAARMTPADSEVPMVGAGGRPMTGAVPAPLQADGALSRFYICPEHPRCPR